MKIKSIARITSKSLGFTMMEVLMIVGILSLLVVSLTVSMRKQRLKAEDATMKDDLNRLKIALEEYYNDNNCYPPPSWLDQCGSSLLSPYLTTIPCHPDGTPFEIEYDSTSCGWFKIYANLHNAEDPQAQALWVDDGSGYAGYNFGVSSTNTTIGINPPPANPSASPSPGSNSYYCSGVGASANCTSFPAGRTCSPGFPDSNCSGACPSQPDPGTCNPT